MLIRELMEELNEIYGEQGDIPVMIWHRSGKGEVSSLTIDKAFLDEEERDEVTFVTLDGGDC